MGKLIKNELCNQVEDILAMVTHVAPRDFPVAWFLNTHVCFALCMLSHHSTPIDSSWNASGQKQDTVCNKPQCFYCTYNVLYF